MTMTDILGDNQPGRRLGTSGLLTPPIALGSWRTLERMDRSDAELLLAYAISSGIRLFDDARYDDETGSAPLASGYSEVLFGELIRAVGAARDEILVSNKLWWEFWPRQDARAELDGSLERMQFDRLDLLYSSTLPDGLSVPVAVEQVAAVLAEGRVTAWGVVNWPAGDLIDAAREARRLSIPAPCAVQLPYSVSRIDWVEDPAMEAAFKAADASLIPSAALAGGALTGKYGAGQSGRLAAELNDPRRRRALRLGDAIRERAAQLRADPGSLAIAFTLLNPRTACTLIGATRPVQIDRAWEGVGLAAQLGDADVRFLRALAGSPSA